LEASAPCLKLENDKRLNSTRNGCRRKVFHEINASIIQIENATTIVPIIIKEIMCKLIDFDSGNSV
jgi:hypothetical protein